MFRKWIVQLLYSIHFYLWSACSAMTFNKCIKLTLAIFNRVNIKRGFLRKIITIFPIKHFFNIGRYNIINYLYYFRDDFDTETSMYVSKFSMSGDVIFMKHYSCTGCINMCTETDACHPELLYLNNPIYHRYMMQRQCWPRYIDILKIWKPISYVYRYK